MKRHLASLGGAIAALVVAAASPAGATVFGEGVIATPDSGPMTIYYRPEAPLGKKVYLRIQGADLVSATWYYSFEHQHLWWIDTPGGAPYLSGDEFLFDGWVSDNQTLDTHAGHGELHYIVASTIDAHATTFLARDLSAYYSDCADPYARPFWVNCSTTPFETHLRLESYVVNPRGPSFSYSLTDVPEPAAWALMITGMGVTGALLRRRRNLAA